MKRSFKVKEIKKGVFRKVETWSMESEDLVLIIGIVVISLLLGLLV